MRKIRQVFLEAYLWPGRHPKIIVIGDLKPLGRFEDLKDCRRAFLFLEQPELPDHSHKGDSSIWVMHRISMLGLYSNADAAVWWCHAIEALRWSIQFKTLLGSMQGTSFPYSYLEIRSRRTIERASTLPCFPATTPWSFHWLPPSPTAYPGDGNEGNLSSEMAAISITSGSGRTERNKTRCA